MVNLASASQNLALVVIITSGAVLLAFLAYLVVIVVIVALTKDTSSLRDLAVAVRAFPGFLGRRPAESAPRLVEQLGTDSAQSGTPKRSVTSS